MRNRPVNPVAILMVFIKTEIILNNQEDYQRGTDANGQSGYIYKGEYFMFPDIPKGYSNIVSKHSISIIDLFPINGNPSRSGIYIDRYAAAGKGSGDPGIFNFPFEFATNGGIYFTSPDIQSNSFI